MRFPILLAVAACACAGAVPAQTAFLYDQQSALEGYGGGAFFTSSNSPFGQSFTPSLSGVGFVRFGFYDPVANDGQGAAFHVELRSGGISGPVLGSTPKVMLPDNFGHGTPNTYVNFQFPTEVPVVSGTQYFFRLTQDSGSEWMVEYYHWPYDGGSGYLKGQPIGWNLWFREGIIVPEPGTGAVLGLGLGLLAWVRSRQSFPAGR